MSRKNVWWVESMLIPFSDGSAVPDPIPQPRPVPVGGVRPPDRSVKSGGLPQSAVG